MTSVSIPIGIQTSGGKNRLPGALHAGTDLGKGSAFALKLESKLAKLAGSDDDVSSQIAALLQNGTPMATIIDRIAKQLTDALINATGNTNDANARSTLQRALAAALAPPGSTTLDGRLKEILSAISSELKKPGQQSDIAGHILDAKPAKEIPARQTKSSPTGAPADDVSTLARALLEKSTPASSDILTRILARAATADAQRPPAAANNEITASAPSLPIAGGKGSVLSPSALFARLVAVIEQHSGAASDARTGKDSSQDIASQQTAVPAAAHSSVTNIPAGTPAFSTQVASAPSSGAPVQHAASQYAAVDPQAVIDQLIKGIAIRSAGNTSELRIRLQPQNLGEVSLKLTVSGNSISASLMAQNPQVRDALLANQQQLSRSLADAGLSLGNFSVNVSGGNAGFAQHQSQQQRSLSKAGAFGVSTVEEEAWADSRFGPPLIAASKSLVLDHFV